MKTKTPPSPVVVLLQSVAASTNERRASENLVGSDRKREGQYSSQGRAPFHVVKNLFGYKKVRQGLGQIPSAAVQPVRAGQFGDGDTM